MSQPRLHHPKLERQRFDPYRPLNWRAEIAEERVTARRTARHETDPWMTRYSAFYRQWRKFRTLSERERLFDRYPDIYYAKTWADAADDFTVTLQSLLLTDMPLDEIAMREDLYLPAVEAFEALFYNVRDRLQNVSYIVRNALSASRGNITLRDSPLLTDERRWACYRIFAYFGGPQALTYAISGFERRDDVNTERLREWSDNTFRSLLRRTTTLIAHAMEPRPANVMRMIELNLKSLELQQTERLASGGTAGPMRELCEMAGRLLEAVQWKIGPSDVDNMPQSERELRTSPFGLTALEADRLAAGEELPELVAAAKIHKLPTARRNERVTAVTKDE
jgi:hypothetical protein